MKVGTEVQWQSQAGGNVTTKQGTIIRVIARGQQPMREDFPTLYKGGKIGSARDHESYVVCAGAGKYYWPIVKKLTALSEDEAQEKAVAEYKALREGLGLAPPTAANKYHGPRSNAVERPTKSEKKRSKRKAERASRRANLRRNAK